jgi:hypothetical protein
VLPLSLLASLNAKFRMAPVTAALVLCAIPGGSIGIALHRIADIALGAIIGTITTLFVFLAYMVVAIWFAILKAKSPQVLTTIVHDMEG